MAGVTNNTGVHQLMQKVSQASELPVYHAVMTGSRGSIKMRDADRREAAVLELGGREVVLVVKNDQTSNTTFKALKHRLDAEGYTIAGLYMAPGPVIDEIYLTEDSDTLSEEAVQKKKAISEAALRTETDSALEKVLARAVHLRASDVHIEIDENTAAIRARVDGDLLLLTRVSRTRAQKMARNLYFRAPGTTKEGEYSESRIIDTKVETEVEGHQVDLRFNSRPGLRGPDITLRILTGAKGNDEAKTLGQLGYDTHIIKALDRTIRCPDGLILFAGPTGSGKSTSLQSCLAAVYQINEGRRKVVTIEDPPEYVIPGARQTPVSKEVKFESALKASLRSDPDIIMVGEVRDSFAAHTLQHAVQTGHLCFSTLHARTPTDAVARAIELGIESSVMCSDRFLLAVMSQKLVKKSCTHCAMSFDKYKRGKNVDADMLARLEVALNELPSIKVANLRFNQPAGHGCDKCNKRGASGRVPVSSLLLPDYRYLDYVRDRRFKEAHLYYRSRRTESGVYGRSKLDYAMQLVGKGIVDPRDVEAGVDLLDEVRSNRLSVEQFKKASTGPVAVTA